MKTESNMPSYIIIALSSLTLLALIWKASATLSLSINAEDNIKPIKNLDSHQSKENKIISLRVLEKLPREIEPTIASEAIQTSSAQELPREIDPAIVSEVIQTSPAQELPRGIDPTIASEVIQTPSAQELPRGIDPTIVSEAIQIPPAKEVAKVQGVVESLIVGDVSALVTPVTAKKVQKRPSKRLPIAFSYNSSQLTPQSYPVLNKLARKLHIHLPLHITIIGHTDSSGDVESNLRLSRERAESVKQYLLGRGIAEERMTVDGYGGAQPIADNSNAAGRLENRRIEIIEENKS